MIKTNKKGFTLIELLVVIAIIGMLSTIVLVSLGSVRKKGRDTKRVADARELQLALEMYYDSNRAFPTALSSLTSGGYIQTLPKDPLTQADYFYAGLQVTGGTAGTCASYHLGVKLEDTLNTALLNDTDASGGTVCTGGGTEFNGTSVSCDTTAGTPSGQTGSTEQCYDIKP
ncbi:MAG: prepilin-type N-terminal cleavage/methylation domain-containing protein [Patescibacteria group bacterium]